MASGHARHKVRSDFERNDFAGQTQRLASLEPTWSVVIMRGQSVQLDCPGCWASFPRGHASQLSAPPRAKVPRLQGEQEGCWTKLVNFPGAHGSHIVAPLSGIAVPISHGLQRTAPSSAEYVPGGQSSQSTAPSRRAKRPGSQMMHAPPVRS